MRPFKIEYRDGTIERGEADFLYVDCLKDVKAIDDVPLSYYGMTEEEIRNELKRIGTSEEHISACISQLPNPRPDLGENNFFKEKRCIYGEKEKLIKKHLENWSGIQKASIDHFAETGKVSGSLFLALKAMMDEYAEQAFEAGQLNIIGGTGHGSIEKYDFTDWLKKICPSESDIVPPPPPRTQPRSTNWC